LLVEENLWDHNGWNATVPGAEATQFNHNVYCQNDSAFTGGRATFRGNISTNASSHGLYLRPGGSLVNNLMLRDPISCRIGYDTAPNFPTGNVTNNVILNGVDIGSIPLGWAINVPRDTNVSVSGNIIAHEQSVIGNNGFGVGLDAQASNCTVQNNIVFDWN